MQVTDRAGVPESTVPDAPALRATALAAWYGRQLAIRNVNLDIKRNRVTAIIGPSGCGKSTALRCHNRMHEVIPGARVEGKVYLEGEDIYAPGIDPVRVRRRIGMVFQKPNPFPMMSIQENVVAGLKLTGSGLATRRSTRSSSMHWSRSRSGARSRTSSASPDHPYRAASSSDSALLERSRCSPRCCSWTNRARHWTR